MLIGCDVIGCLRHSCGFAAFSLCYVTDSFHLFIFRVERVLVGSTHVNTINEGELESVNKDWVGEAPTATMLVRGWV